MATQQTLLSQLRTVHYADYIDKTIDQIKESNRLLKEKISNLEIEYKNLSESIKSLEIKKKGLETNYEANDKSLAETKEELEVEKDKIQKSLKENDFASIEEVNDILAKTRDIPTVKKEIERFKIHYKTIKNELAILKAKLKNKEFDNAGFDKIKETIRNQKSEIKRIDNEIGGLERMVNQLKNDLITKKKFEEELNKKQIRQEDLKTMRSLFTGSGFVNYVSTVRLQEVVNYANARFIKLTKGSMKLELAGNNSFNIIDFLNGGKPRSIKTLSGGQTFQASLSLALALASIVQQQSKSEQNFFFLDEGFGTQDEESMRLVFNAIKELRKENRTIGLISHVSELKEEINTFLEIEKDDQEGSRILTSW